MRQRNVDPSKPLAIVYPEEAVNAGHTIQRAQVALSTGIDKEEDSEYHLLEARAYLKKTAEATRKAIPVPKISKASDKFCEENYFFATQNDKETSIDIIHIGIEPDLVEYNASTDDIKWVEQSGVGIGLDVDSFEKYMEMLERGQPGDDMRSEAIRAAIRQESSAEIELSIYDYWLTKRIEKGKSLIPRLKSEKRDGSSAKDPYVAFRRRAERIQTRKNRKNEKLSHAALYSLRNDYSLITDLMKKVYKRESLKHKEFECRNHLFNKCLELRDYDGSAFYEAEKKITMQREIDLRNRLREEGEGDASSQGESHTSSITKKKKKKKKREHDGSEKPVYADSHSVLHSPYNSFDDTNSADGRYTFLRKAHCAYHEALPEEDMDISDEEQQPQSLFLPNIFHFAMGSKSSLIERAAYARTRIARCSRIFLDVLSTSHDKDLLDELSDMKRKRYIPAEFVDS